MHRPPRWTAINNSKSAPFSARDCVKRIPRIHPQIREKRINQRNLSQLTALLFLKAKQNENLTASGSHYYTRRYWSRHNEMRNDVLCPSRYVRDAEMLVKSLVFPHVCLWLSVASAVALGSRSLEWISAKLFSSSDSFNCLHWELRLQRWGCFPLGSSL